LLSIDAGGGRGGANIICAFTVYCTTLFLKLHNPCVGILGFKDLGSHDSGDFHSVCFLVVYFVAVCWRTEVFFSFFFVL